jgi:transposase
MAYKKGEERRQKVLFLDCIDEYVGEDAPVRLFDAFIDSLDMDKLKFIRSTPKNTGQSENPVVLFLSLCT